MNRRKRKSSALRRIELKYGIKFKPAKASNYLYSLVEYLKRYPDIVVIIYCRVSARMQGHKGNLDNHEKVLRRILRKLNIPVIGCYREISSGWVLNDDRLALINAVKEAKKYKGKKEVVTRR